MIRSFPFLYLFAWVQIELIAATLHVGPGQTYPNLATAVSAVQPGDTIEIHAGSYPGGLYFGNLQGMANKWITLRAATGETVVFEGGSNAIQLTDPAYLHLRGLIFQHQTGNGFNTDDGGSYGTPAHHIIFEHCTFRDMSASGNNDLLKLSGLDHFEIRNCTFQNGAAGGSGIDMVGCHYGVIRGNYFENLGSNSIQCKGGSEHIRIEGNFFKNGGLRALNLGGSTGLAFFRPDTAHFEAANLQVYSNVFIGAQAAVAFVGSVNVEVVNNTIYQPERWVIRILQETVDPGRFLECGDNVFRNNIVVRNAGLSTETNTGPSTRPQTFTFSNNLWYYPGNPGWAGPSIPVPETNGIINQNPLLTDPANGDFHIPPGSPAAGKGFPSGEPVLDFYGLSFNLPRSVGAAEANPVSGSHEAPDNPRFRIFPNPVSGQFWIELELKTRAEVQIVLLEQGGRRVRQLFSGALPAGMSRWPAQVEAPAGVYWIEARIGGATVAKKVVFF